MLVDTGSTENILAESHCPRQYVRNLTNPISIRTAAGHIRVTKEALVPKGSMHLILRQDPVFRIFEFHPTFAGIFGSTLLKENNASIDYERKTLVINNQEVPLYFEGDNEEEEDVRVSDLPELYHLDECNKKYTQATNLGIHKRIVHRNIRFECNICKRQFKMKNSLKQHFIQKHPKQKLSYKETEAGDDREKVTEPANENRKNTRRNRSPVPTVHSASEDGNDHIPITDKPLQYFEKQILIKNGAEDKYELVEKHGKKRYEFTYSKDDKVIDTVVEIIGREENVTVYCEDERIYLRIQDDVVKMRNIKDFRILRTYGLVEDVDKESLMEIILRHHKYENNHPGIEKTYQELKCSYYYPNLKREITRVINNCEICNFKIERRPIKLPYEKTVTPKGPHEIYHADIWYMSRGRMYLTIIDKFSKYAFVQGIEDRTPLCLIKAFTIAFNSMKAPRLLVTDNETALATAIFKDFLEKKNIELHLTTPNRHTGNSDIERFHSSLNENIRLFRKREEEDDIAYNIDLVVQANYSYNTTIHLTTQRRPIDVHFAGNKIDLQDVYRRIEETKGKSLEYRNKDRKDAEVNQEFRKIANAQKIDARQERTNVEQVDNRHYITGNKHLKIYKDQLLRRKNHFRSTDVLVDGNDIADNQPGTGTETGDY